MNDKPDKSTRVSKITDWLFNNPFVAVVIVIGLAVIAVAKFTDAVVAIEKFFGWRTEHTTDVNSSELKIPLAPSAIDVIKAAHTVDPPPGTIQTWRRLDSDKQRGFYESQLDELSEKLTEARVRPNGVKFMMGIRADTHEAWISVFVREGDNVPLAYSVRKEKNDGVPGLVETKIIQQLSDHEVLPIGWTHQSESFIYAAVSLQLSVR